MSREFSDDLAAFVGLEDQGFQPKMKRILEFLQARFDFGLWMFTKVENDDWMVISAQDNGYGVKDGDLFRWSHSYCQRMVAGLGPQIAPDSSIIPAYAEAEIGRFVPIRSYVGIPVQSAEKGLFGTLCAIDPEPKGNCLEQHVDDLNMLGLMIAEMVETELKLQSTERKAQLAGLSAHRDSLTGIKNRTAWIEYLEAEEERATRFANPVGLLVLDLDDLKVTNDSGGHQAGDALLTKFAELLDVCVAEWGTAFRIGGDEFACLLPGCGPTAVEHVTSHIRDVMTTAGIRVSIGVAMRSPATGLNAAWDQADQAMYTDKARRAVAEAA